MKKLPKSEARTIILGKTVYRGAPPVYTVVQTPIPDTDPQLYEESVVQVRKGTPYIRVTDHLGNPRDFSIPKRKVRK